MTCFIVPNSLSNAINAKLDAAIAECPDAAPDREIFYQQLLGYFNEHGTVPDFQIAPVSPKITLTVGSPEPGDCGDRT